MAGGIRRGSDRQSSCHGGCRQQIASVIRPPKWGLAMESDFGLFCCFGGRQLLDEGKYVSLTELRANGEEVIAIDPHHSEYAIDPQP